MRIITYGAKVLIQSLLSVFASSGVHDEVRLSSMESELFVLSNWMLSAICVDIKQSIPVSFSNLIWNCVSQTVSSRNVLFRMENFQKNARNRPIVFKYKEKICPCKMCLSLACSDPVVLNDIFEKIIFWRTLVVTNSRHFSVVYKSSVFSDSTRGAPSPSSWAWQEKTWQDLNVVSLSLKKAWIDQVELDEKRGLGKLGSLDRRCLHHPIMWNTRNFECLFSKIHTEMHVDSMADTNHSHIACRVTNITDSNTPSVSCRRAKRNSSSLFNYIISSSHMVAINQWCEKHLSLSLQKTVWDLTCLLILTMRTYWSHRTHGWLVLSESCEDWKDRKSDSFATSAK